ncbi:acyltransferase [Clostridium vincentii]|uniref:Galactoside O-acetyltransferase n=1 Tax=Clostridium vincentii TaxID=52704 RepID=A0A2T0BCZ3_9CLOT|nr:DapH/DapD/GlmU-related protein [Clostridium vincentii]PRR81766.1 Galactoside O-acetyltransferase [Clostridium vincentii]
MNIVKYFWGLRAVVYKFRFEKIGRLSYIGKPIILEGTKRVKIGSRVRIYPGVRIETHGKEAGITIEDNVAIGQNFHITSSDSDLKIGKDTTILGNVFITNIDHDYRQIGVHILKQKYLTKETRIGQNCFIGYGAAIQAGTILGKQCIVGANSVVRGKFPDYCIIVGAPAKVVKKYNHDTGEWEKIKK